VAVRQSHSSLSQQLTGFKRYGEAIGIRRGMRADFPEVKEMVEAAKLYIGGSIGVHELHGAVAQCAHVAKKFSAHQALTEVTGEWLSMVNRYWNEWGFRARASF